MPTPRASRSAAAEQFTFTPDGTGIVFTARDAVKEEAWSTDLDLFEAPIDGGSPPRKLTSENRATDTDPLVQPRRHAPRLPRDGPSADEADK